MASVAIVVLLSLCLCSVHAAVDTVYNMRTSVGTYFLNSGRFVLFGTVVDI